MILNFWRRVEVDGSITDYNLQVSLKTVAVLAAAERQRPLGMIFPTTPRCCCQQRGHHYGRVSVSLYPPVTGCSQACPHA